MRTRRLRRKNTKKSILRSTRRILQGGNGNIQYVNDILANPDADINQLDNHGRTPLYIASANGNIEYVKKLLANSGIDINKTKTISNDTPLYVAAKNKHIEIVRLLLSSPSIDVNNVFYLAIKNGETDIVRILIEEPLVNINKQLQYRFPPIRVAVELGQLEIVKLLLDHPRIILDRIGLLDSAVRNGFVSIVKLLLADPRIDINEAPAHGGSTPLLSAIRNGNIEIVKLLLADPRIDINKLTQNNTMTPFLAAIKKNDTGIIKLLLTDSRLNIANNLYQELVSDVHDADILKQILTHLSIANRNEYSNLDTAFKFAIKKGNTLVFEVLLNSPHITITNDLMNEVKESINHITHMMLKIKQLYPNEYVTYDKTIDAEVRRLIPILRNKDEMIDNLIVAYKHVSDIIELRMVPELMDVIKENVIEFEKVTSRKRRDILYKYIATICNIIRNKYPEYKFTECEHLFALPNALNVKPGILNTNVPERRIINKRDLHFSVEDGITILTMPAGMLLYHSFYVGESEPVINRILKLMGGIIPPGSTAEIDTKNNKLLLKGCIDQFQQKFFFSNPAGGDALSITTNDVGFNSMCIYETTRDMRFAVLMSPSPHHRIAGQSHPSKNTCDKLSPSMCACDRTPYNKCRRAYDYDVCLTPEFLNAHSLDGHIAIAEADSYNKLMKMHDKEISTSIFADKPYKLLTRLIYDGGRSIDKRVDNTGEHIISGFPEIVIHIFGTDWYNRTKSMKYEYTINLPNSYSDKEIESALTDFLLDVNSNNISMGFKSALKLISHSTIRGWYDIYNVSIVKSMVDPTYKSIFYLNSLLAYMKRAYSFYFDTRTGFMIREGSLYTPNIRVEDGSIISFKDVSMRGSEGSRGSTALEKSYTARLKGEFWDKNNILIPAENTNIMRVTRGGRRTIRLLAKNKGISHISMHATKKNMTTANRNIFSDSRKNSMNTEHTYNANETDDTCEVIRLEYTPPPVSEETLEFIKRALAVPQNVPSVPYDMSNYTYALLDIILHMAALRKSSSRQGTVKYN